MNRRSPASTTNPAPTGAVDWAWTRGVNVGPPRPDTIIATSVTIDHGFAERIRRQVRGLEALIIESSLQGDYRTGWGTSDCPTFNSSVRGRTCRPQNRWPTGGRRLRVSVAARRGTRLWKRVGSY